MLTACVDELPNPHKNCIKELLDSMVCYYYDYQRINVELKNLRQEFKKEVNEVAYQYTERRKFACASRETLEAFEKKVESIDLTVECFNKRIAEMKEKRAEVLRNSKKCLTNLRLEKCKLKHFHERTIDYLKKHSVSTEDPKVKQRCEKDINEMNRQFVKEVAYIKKCDDVLLPFMKLLHDCDNTLICDCYFQGYDWLPCGEGAPIIEEVEGEIKCVMGSTLIKAFSNCYIHHPSDEKSFLSAYLMNLQHSEDIMKAKLKLFELRK
ncbi:uncharacterized protein LOC119642547 [Glossina fuscipes]|uniref:Uncharacterized protein LOC119642547 n=1 Tax=Glossina fuscipes TaxID=7396 RepID=A0A9C5ZJW6_9MUSC|nr:uncharacterized protein LOC119642547 [Glossina fuscipes]KAI9576331.1 hypothetical protein GQX74_000126 [Glossina fuscipes]